MAQIGAILPATHHFVFKSKEYPFNFQLFLCFSEYLQKNQKEFINIKSIPLIEEEENMNLTEQSIQDFICYCQNQIISINNDNAVPLSKLSHKYQVKQLIDASKQYIIDHHDELIFDIYSYNSQNDISDNIDYEQVISDHLLDYIENGQLIKLPFKFDVLMFGVDGYDCYLTINDEFLALLEKYRECGGHLLFLHDFNSGSKSVFKKEYQPFSSYLGFKGIRGVEIFKRAKFVSNKSEEIQLFPYKINDEFDVAETHETPIYDPNYIIIKSSTTNGHYYCENSEKRIADCSMGHSKGISLDEKKLLYNIIYHLSQLP